MSQESFEEWRRDAMQMAAELREHLSTAPEQLASTKMRTHPDGRKLVAAAKRCSRSAALLTEQLTRVGTVASRGSALRRLGKQEKRD